jgi:hypothetical protein
MNKFLTITSVLLLAVSGYLGFEVYQLRHPQPPINKSKLAANTCPSMSYDYSHSSFEGIINYETAKGLFDNYNKDKKGMFVYNGKEEVLVPGEDSKSVWFSLDRLKNFIWHIENQNCENPNHCTDSLGLRIYFGRYPDLYHHQSVTEEGLNNVPKEYSFRHTLFMVPTYKDENTGIYRDFYPGGKDCRTALNLLPTHIFAEQIITDITPYIFLFDVSGPTGDSQNHGGLIPPGASTGNSFN